MKKENIIIVLLIGLIVLIGVKNFSKENGFLSGMNTQTYSGLTRSTTTIDKTASTALISPGDVNVILRIYNLSTSTVYLYATSTNSSTGVAVNGGIPLNAFATSTTNWTDLSGLRGYLYAISDGNGSLISIVKQ